MPGSGRHGERTARPPTAPASRRGSRSRSPQADLVFVGTVDRVEPQGNGFLYDITASRAYQGTPERETQVLSAGGRDACGLGELGVGTGYVFFATGTETPYAADACGGTSVANPTKVDKVEELLGEGTAVEPPPPPTAQLTQVEDAAPAGFARAAAPGAAAVLSASSACSSYAASRAPDLDSGLQRYIAARAVRRRTAVAAVLAAAPGMFGIPTGWP